MAQHFVLSLKTDIDWAGFIGSNTLEDLFFSLDEMGLDPYSVIFRQVERTDINILLPFLPTVHGNEVSALEDAEESFCPDVCISPASMNLFDLSERTVDIYREAMELIASNDKNSDWRAFKTVNKTSPHYECSNIVKSMAERRKKLLADINNVKQPTLTWWLPVQESELMKLVDVPVMISNGKEAFPFAAKLTMIGDDDFQWTPLLPNIEPPLFETVTQYMPLAH